MKLIPLVGLAALMAASAGPAALAQSQYGPNENPNVQAYRDYQTQRNVYDEQADAYARQRDDYDQHAADYRAERRAYERRLRAYERARAMYDAQYGPGAYEYYYPAPLPPD